MGISPVLCSNFLCLYVLPTAIRSTVTFASVTNNGITTTIYSTSTSDLLKVFLSPLLINLIVGIRNTKNDLRRINGVVLRLLLPFILKRLSQP